MANCWLTATRLSTDRRIAKVCSRLNCSVQLTDFAKPYSCSATSYSALIFLRLISINTRDATRDQRQILYKSRKVPVTARRPVLFISLAIPKLVSSVCSGASNPSAQVMIRSSDNTCEDACEDGCEDAVDEASAVVSVIRIPVG